MGGSVGHGRSLAFVLSEMKKHCRISSRGVTQSNLMFFQCWIIYVNFSRLDILSH